ncbi:MAG: RICIN domain-containing protein, partial [Faecalibacterium sp.]|nr:RICIN domain-containing protein [Faecalibacterium sp.]
MAKASHVILREDEFYVIAAPNGKVLEVADYNMDNGAAIQLWDYAGQPWQQWKFVISGDDEYRIQNRFTGKMIDLAMSGVVAG